MVVFCHLLGQRKQRKKLGMHDIGYFADIRYADILQLIWPTIDTDTDIYVYFFPTPNHRDHRVSFEVEFTYSIIIHSLTVLARWQMQALNTKLKIM